MAAVPSPAFPALAYPGVTYPNGYATDTRPGFNLRFDVAFSTSPDAAAPAWVDLSSRVHLPSGVSVRRGRGDEFEQAQPGTLGLTLENLDGALTPNKTDSPYAPFVLPKRRCRLTYRNPATLGTRNMLAAEDASFEGGTTGAWVGSGGATIANSATHVDVGTKALQVTWPTAAAGAATADLALTGLSAGRAYTARARVWVTAGTPNVRLQVSAASSQYLGTPTSVKGAFVEIVVQFTASAYSETLQLTTFGTSTTAGQLVWMDAVMVDEGTWSTAPTFSTTAPTDVILPRFEGYVDEWPVEWPDGGDQYSRAAITANDVLARLSDREKLRSVVVETFALDKPVAHLPLGEPQGSTSAASIIGDALVVTPVQFGTGGALTFGSGTGVPTDGQGAPQFAPANVTNGLALVATNVFPNGVVSSSSPDATLVVAVNTTSAINATIGCLSDGRGSTLMIELLATGKLAATLTDGNLGTSSTIASAATYNDGKTHHVAASLGFEGGGTLTLRLRVDGAADSSTTVTTAFPVFNTLAIGGLPTGGQLFTGTISHVAVFGAFVPLARLLEQRTSQTTGFSGETSDARIRRLATWIGLPSERLQLDAGNSAIAHIDPTGLSPLDYLRKVEAAEAGILFAGRDGRLTLHNRARQYTPRASADVTVDSRMLGETTRLAMNLQLVTNDVTGSRTGGATVRMTDPTSITNYGQSATTLDLALTTDADVAGAVGWRLNTSSKPLTRFTDMQLDAMTDATQSPSIPAYADIGARVQILNMPAQVPVQMTQQVQGYTETINDSTWTVSVNATPFDQLMAFILDDASWGVIEGFGHIVF